MKIFGYPGDAFGSIHSFWWVKFQGLIHWWGGMNEWVNYPFGTYEPAFREFIASRPAEILALLTNEIFAYNFFMLASFPLAFIAMFFLVKYLTQSNWIGIWAGLIYAFSPYHHWQALTHFSLAQIHWIPIYFWVLLQSEQYLSRRWALTLVAVFFLLFFSSFYYGYFIAILTLLFWIIKAIYTRLVNQQVFISPARLQSWVWMLLAGVIVFSFPFYLARRDYQITQNWHNLANNAYQRNPEFMLYLSARPWDYFLPSVDNPWLGQFSQTFRERLHFWESQHRVRNPFWIDVGNLEGTLYVGIAPLALAIYGLFNLKQSRFRTEMKVLAWLALISFLFSLQPYIKFDHFQLVLPSIVLGWLSSIFRTLSRWGFLVQFLIILLASQGLNSLQHRLTFRFNSIILFGVALILGVFEFASQPLFHFVDVSEIPIEYTWLSQQKGDFAVAEYELDSNVALFYQRIHQKKLVSAELTELSLADPITPLVMQKNKVRYILLHLTKPFSTEFNPTTQISAAIAATEPTVQTTYQITLTHHQGRPYACIQGPVPPSAPAEPQSYPVVFNTADTLILNVNSDFQNECSLSPKSPI